MSLLLQNLTIRPESIQSLFASYLAGGFLVNRRYQRKLVWTIEEKRAFVDSLKNGFPVPLFLFSESDLNGKSILEVIDGMQRLNAVFSFLEGEFDIEGKYFDLEAIPETKQLKSKGDAIQKTPLLPLDDCRKIVTYQVPLSVARDKSDDEVDEIFRRINSYGRHLSKQELRQAGSTSNFAQLVRKLAAKIRGDASGKDRLFMGQMKEISITNKELTYGLDVGKIFWAENKILTPDQVRESRDEELIADMLGYVLLDPHPSSRSEVLNEYYGDYRSEDGRARCEGIERAVQKHSEDALIARFLRVHNEVRSILSRAQKPFNVLMFDEAGARVPRYYQAVFLALYELLIRDGMRVHAPMRLITLLDGIGKKITVSEGGRWSPSEREGNVNAVKGMIASAFRKARGTDPALDSWVTEFENILTQSSIENNLYDWKLGLHRLTKPYSREKGLVRDIAQTLSAMANFGKDAAGYVIVGLTDDEKAARRLEHEHSVVPQKFRGFHVCGVDHEASMTVYAKGLDTYLQTIIQELQRQPMTKAFLDQVLKDAKVFSYFDKHLIVLKVASRDEPCSFDEEYFQRSGSHLQKIEGEALKALFKRFA